MTDRDNHRANKANVSAARAAAAEAARAARIATEEQSRRLPKGPTMLNKTSQTLALLLPPYADARRLPVGAGTAAGGSASVAGAPAKLTLPRVVTAPVPMPWCSTAASSTSSSAARCD
jgi:hypothetical protein